MKNARPTTVIISKDDPTKQTEIENNKTKDESSGKFSS